MFIIISTFYPKRSLQIEHISGKVWLADFGLGRLATSLLGAGRTTMNAGTPAFQPPEQLKGERCGTGSDIYALGCVVVELFSEKKVWSKSSPHTIIFKVVGGEYPSTTNLPDCIQAITKLCFVKFEERAGALAILKQLCLLCAGTAVESDEP